jgi:2'-5' RNA ligase
MTSNQGIAIDVVLLPPPRIEELAIGISRELADHTIATPVVLNTEDCLPHISLGMGAVNLRQLGIIDQELDELTAASLPLNLEVERLAVVRTHTGETVSGFDIRCTEDLQLLHEWVITLISQFGVGEVTRDMVYAEKDEEIVEFTTSYIAGYERNSSFLNYSPHITLGYGDAGDACKEICLPLPFAASRLAICHLGNYCTCRRIISIHGEHPH